ncbi:hypothetical protein PFHG_05515 [Plasmodium falciparum HB3]|uniref:Plasmodium falciparum erythrocyte membrane protein 1 acidic terminal segment domain-containing protein n=1 Tax=Plasmodium falciparum (isolate HB3) TaxID=137071 RepID=A0A0L7KMJ6_PLAFX|nr:hypothetical protein PFHG_05515 [Plasmodium falciparum HB3]
MFQNEPNDVPNDYSSCDIPFNTQPNTLYLDKPEEKPFITSIHDRNLYTGEEYNYNIHMSSNSMDDIPINSHNNVYSGIDLINDSLNSDRHRNMCEKWENHHERLAKLKEQWENDTSTSGNTHPSDSNKTLNTNVSIQIHMDDPKPINEFSNMDTILEDLEKYNEPYYDVQDDIYYDVNDHDTSTVDSNNMDVPSKVQIEMDVNTKLVKEKYPIADVWDI